MVKTDHFRVFDRKREPNLAKMTKMTILTVFDCFWPFSRHLWFFGVFDGFSYPQSVRFSLGFWENHEISLFFREKHEISWFRPKCHRQIWYLRMSLFWLKNMKNCQFSTFPWGLDRGFWQKCQPVRSGVSLVVHWCQNGQKVTFP